MQRSWISRYDAGVPATSEYPAWTVPDLLRHSASRFPDSPALFFYGTRLSFLELNDLTTRFALGLWRLGVRPGDRVALMLPNIPQAVIAYYGVLKAGATVSPTNPLYVEREIESQLIDSGSETVVALDLFYPRISAVRKRTHVPERIIITCRNDDLFHVDLLQTVTSPCATSAHQPMSHLPHGVKLFATPSQ